MLRNRFPRWRDILPVYAVISALLYSWTAIAFLRSYTVNWILFLKPGELAGMAAYLLVSDLLEAVTVAGGLVVLSAMLPRRWLREPFVVRGTILVVALLGSMMVYMLRFPIDALSKNGLYWALAFLGTAAVVLFIAETWGGFRRALASLADRFVILVYLLVPLSLLALILVVARNVA